jgi:hypothetical protein
LLFNYRAKARQGGLRGWQNFSGIPCRKSGNFPPLHKSWLLLFIFNYRETARQGERRAALAGAHGVDSKKATPERAEIKSTAV